MLYYDKNDQIRRPDNVLPYIMRLVKKAEQSQNQCKVESSSQKRLEDCQGLSNAVTITMNKMWLTINTL